VYPTERGRMATERSSSPVAKRKSILRHSQLMSPPKGRKRTPSVSFHTQEAAVSAVPPREREDKRHDFSRPADGLPSPPGHSSSRSPVGRRFSLDERPLPPPSTETLEMAAMDASELGGVDGPLHHPLSHWLASRRAVANAPWLQVKPLSRDQV
jgi:hypothetical protein